MTGAPPEEVRRRVHLADPEGLHARPCAALARLARGARGATLRVRAGDVEVDATSVLELMTLCARKGTALELIGRGRHAARLVEEAARILTARPAAD